MSSNKKENRKVPRIRIEKPLKVVMGSIGASVRYEMTTRNVSTTGFFLEFDKPGRFPFSPSSIMEVWLELEAGLTIFFNGKMARVVYPEESQAKETGPGIAVRIVQIDKENEEKLIKFVEAKHKSGKNKDSSAA